jgi:hypothetical protein
MIKPRRMRWAEHVTGRGAKGNACRVSVVKRRKETTGKTGVDGRLILKLILEK